MLCLALRIHLYFIEEFVSVLLKESLAFKYLREFYPKVVGTKVSEKDSFVPDSR